MTSFRTDLAEESHQHYRLSRGEAPSGVRLQRYQREMFSVSDLRITTEEAACALEKPRGRYVTASCPSLTLQDSRWVHTAALTLAPLLRQLLPQEGTVLVLGLGNRAITPDRLGSAVMEHLIVTRHLRKALPDTFGNLRPVCALAPGVLGITGMETGEIALALVQQLRPAAVLAIDALCAAEPERLCASFQFSDTGIAPGSGAGNHRDALTRETLGVPVIAVGVPTVIAGGDEKYPLLMTPTDIDLVIGKCARILGYAADMALLGDLSPEELDAFLC